jgi:hypothetical protein
MRKKVFQEKSTEERINATALTNMVATYVCNERSKQDFNFEEQWLLRIQSESFAQFKSVDEFNRVKRFARDRAINSRTSLQELQYLLSQQDCREPFQIMHCDVCGCEADRQHLAMGDCLELNNEEQINMSIFLKVIDMYPTNPTPNQAVF